MAVAAVGAVFRAGIIISAVDRASRIFTGVGDSAEKSGGKIGMFTKALGKLMFFGQVLPYILAGVGALIATIGASAAAVRWDKYTEAVRSATFQMRVFGVQSHEIVERINAMRRAVGVSLTTELMASVDAIGHLNRMGQDMQTMISELAVRMSDKGIGDFVTNMEALSEFFLNHNPEPLRQLGIDFGDNATNSESAAEMLERLNTALDEMGMTDTERIAQGARNLGDRWAELGGHFEFVTTASDKLRLAVNWLATVIVDGLLLAVQIIGLFLHIAKVTFVSVLEIIKAPFQPGKIGEILNDWALEFREKIKDIGETIRRLWYSFGGRFVNATIGWLVDVTTEFQKFSESLLGKIADFFELLGGWWTEAVTWVIEKVKEAWDKVKNLLDDVDVFGFISDAWDTVWNGMLTWLGELDIFKPVREKFTEVMAWIKEKWEEFKQLLNPFSGEGDGLFGTGFQLPGFASGGLVNAPIGTAVPAMLHGGELVIPPSDSRFGSALGGEIHIKLQIGDKEIGEIAVDAVHKEIKWRGGVVNGMVVG